MRSSFRFFLLALLAVCPALTVRAEGVFHFTGSEGSAGDTVSVALALSHEEAVTALQLQVPLTSETHYVEGSATLSERRADHTVTAHEVDGRLNVVIVSPTLQALQGSEGVLLTFKLCLGRKPEELPLTLSKRIVRTAAGDTLSTTVAAGAAVTTRCAVAAYSAMTVDYGRVPIRGRYTQQIAVSNTGNAPLTVSGLTFSSADFSTPDATWPLTIEAGGSRTLTLAYAPLERGEVSETLRVACNSTSRLNTLKLTATPFAVNELHVQPAAGVCDSSVTVAVTMNNMDSITGLQMTFELPEEVEYEPGSFALSERGADMTLAAGLNGRTLTAVAYSTSGHAFAAHDGTVATFGLRLRGPNSTWLVPIHAVLTAIYRGQTLNVLSATEGANVHIASPRISLSTNVDMGRTPIPDTVRRVLSVYNYGNAPLHLSRAVFSTSGYVTAEALPLVVEAGEQRNLTLEYRGTERGNIDGVLRLYCNDPTTRMAQVDIAGQRYVTNALTLLPSRAFKGRSARLQVAVENHFDIKGMQFNLIYPREAFTLNADSAFVLSQRAQGMQVQWRAAGDTLKVYLYSLTDSPLEVGSGTVLTLNLNTRADATFGSASFRATGIKMSRTLTDEVHSDLTDPTATTDIGLKGDANSDRTVNITDVTATGSYVVDGAGDLDTAAADMNDDGAVNITDVTMIGNVIIN